jgi:transposase
MVKKRVSYSACFKSKVALSAVRQEKTISQLASQYHVHPVMIGKWKSQLLERCEEIFRDGRKREKNDNPTLEELYQKIGRLEVENDFLKKKSVELTGA